MLPAWAARDRCAGEAEAAALLDGSRGRRRRALRRTNHGLGRRQRAARAVRQAAGVAVAARARSGLLERALRAAHAADPAAALFVNEWGAELPGRKADGLLALCRGLLERGAPLHGLGFQMHLAARARSGAPT